MLRSTCLLFLLLIASSLTRADENRVLLDSANSAYSRNDYESAKKNYETIINSGYEASEVYYNLANSYYKLNKTALAILNYEKALKLSPNDEDILFNLKLANQRIVDKIEVIPQLFLTEWKEDLASSYSEKGWSIACILFLSLSLILMAIYLTTKRLILKQISFWIGLLLFTSSLITFFVAKSQYKLATEKKEAIIISSTIDVNSSPSENGTKVFILHEGTKVTITETSTDWVEIKIANGNVGWVRASDIAFI